LFHVKNGFFQKFCFLQMRYVVCVPDSKASLDEQKKSPAFTGELKRFQEGDALPERGPG